MRLASLTPESDDCGTCLVIARKDWSFPANFVPKSTAAEGSFEIYHLGLRAVVSHRLVSPYLFLAKRVRLMANCRKAARSARISLGRAWSCWTNFHPGPQLAGRGAVVLTLVLTCYITLERALDLLFSYSFDGFPDRSGSSSIG